MEPDAGSNVASASTHIQALLHEADVQPQKAVDLADPLAVALSKVVIHRDHVHAFATQRIQVRRQHLRPALFPGDSQSKASTCKTCIHGVYHWRHTRSTAHRNQRLALSGAHLRNLALVQDHAADELDIEGSHVEHPL